MPALLISTVTGPSAASAASTAFAMDAVSVTSSATAAARPAVAADLLFQILQLVGLPCRERDGRAVRRQHPGKLPPQPLAGTGDEDGFFTDVE
jgi:hypothetical protein